MECLNSCINSYQTRQTYNSLVYVPVIGTLACAARVAAGTLQVISGIALSIIFAAPAICNERSREIVRESIDSIKQGLFNIAMGALQAIPLIGCGFVTCEMNGSSGSWSSSPCTFEENCVEKTMSSIEDAFSDAAFYPIVGTFTSVGRAAVGSAQFVTALALTIILAVPSICSEGARSLIKRTSSHMVHGLANIAAAVVEAVPFAAMVLSMQREKAQRTITHGFGQIDSGDETARLAEKMVEERREEAKRLAEKQAAEAAQKQQKTNKLQANSRGGDNNEVDREVDRKDYMYENDDERDSLVGRGRKFEPDPLYPQTHKFLAYKVLSEPYDTVIADAKAYKMKHFLHNDNEHRQFYGINAKPTRVKPLTRFAI